MLHYISINQKVDNGKEDQKEEKEIQRMDASKQ